MGYDLNLFLTIKPKPSMEAFRHVPHILILPRDIAAFVEFGGEGGPFGEGGDGEGSHSNIEINMTV